MNDPRKSRYGKTPGDGEPDGAVRVEDQGVQRLAGCGRVGGTAIARPELGQRADIGVTRIVGATRHTGYRVGRS